MANRVLTVSGFSVYDRKEAPAIRLQGRWLEALGFGIGRKITIEEQHGELLLRLVPEEKKEEPPQKRTRAKARI